METNALAPAAPSTKRRQRTPLSVTRDRVLVIAEQLFRRNGVQAVSVDAIAQAAGIKKMTLYRCFPCKEELVMACMAHWETIPRRLWEQAREEFPDEPARQLLAFSRLVCDIVSRPDYTGNICVHLMTDYTDPGHPICVRVRELRAELRAHVRKLAQQAEAADPDQLADAYCLMLEGMLIVCRTYGCDSGTLRNAPAVMEKFLRQNCGPRAFPPEPRRFRRW